jgi:demethylspheroidene O-methyltransferase
LSTPDARPAHPVAAHAASAAPAPEPAARWRERWLNTRNRILVSPRFHRWARRLPLLRLATRRHARGFYDLCAGFIYSQVLYACVRLDLFEQLRAGPQPLDALATALAVPQERLEILLLAARALQLVERCGERWALGMHGAALLAQPGIAAMVLHHRLLYADLADPLPLLRGVAPPGQLAGYWAYTGEALPAAGSTADYSRLMASSQAMIADDILDAYPVRRHRRLLDIGGGHGAFLLAAAARAPALQLCLFDLPSVAAQAAERFAAAGLGGRAQAVGGSVFGDAPPSADLVSLVRILHDHDDAQAMVFLRAARAALEPGGTLLIAEPMAEPARGDPAVDTYFGLYLMAMGQGRPRTPARLMAMAREAGFVACRERPTAVPMLTRLLVAEAPAAGQQGDTK